MDKIKFYIKTYKKKLSLDTEFPCITLIPDSWNDFGWKTMFHMYFYVNESDRTEIGYVKILDAESDDTILNPIFSKLPDNQCSLGQSIEYYLNLKKVLPNNYLEILDSLNDVAVNNGLRTEFEVFYGFEKSLIRTSEAEKALNQARQALEGGEDSIQSSFKFSYSINLENVNGKHTVDFDFDNSIDDSFKNIVLIGKNGTGKTQYLSNLGFALCGGIDSTSKTLRIINSGEFSPSRPLFSRIIVISYSLFDKFKIPEQSKKYSYKYIGFRDNDEILTNEEISKKLRSYFIQIKRLKRENEWLEFINEVVELENFGQETITALQDEKDFEKVIRQQQDLLSSGQNILIFTVTGLIANLRRDSIVLFDEPETHLHPNAIARLIKVTNKILDFYNSYSIIATHSPIVVQETPSKMVKIFDRIGNTPIIKNLPDESFGENISKITDFIFYRNQVKESYKEFFDEKVKELTLQQINELFNSKLSFNALLYLNAIITEEK